MPNFIVRSAFRFTDGRTGMVADARIFQADGVDDAKRLLVDLIGDRPGLEMVSAVVMLEATGSIVWTLKAPISAEAIASFGAGLPPGAGT